MERAAWVGILPGAAIFVTALTVTMIGQGLDARKKRRPTARTTRAPGAPAEEPATPTAIKKGEAL